MYRGLTALAAVLCVMGTASAADLGRMPVKAPAMVQPVDVFSGFYVGAHLGYGWGARDDSDTDGVIGGGQLGYNWQIQNWVLGLEGQMSGSGMKGNTAIPGASIATDINWLGSVTGKLGYVVAPTTMLYAKGGVAFADYDYTATVLGVTSSAGKTRTGWTVGAGLEWAFAPNWSTFAEYQYYDFGSDTFNFTGLAAADLDSSVHTVKVGVNYRFGR